MVLAERSRGKRGRLSGCIAANEFDETNFKLAGPKQKKQCMHCTIMSLVNSEIETIAYFM